MKLLLSLILLLVSTVGSYAGYFVEVRNKQGFGTWSYDYYEMHVRYVQGTAPDGHYGTFIFNEDGGLFGSIAVDCANGTCSPADFHIFSGTAANLSYPSGHHTLTFKTPEPHSNMQNWQPNYWGFGDSSLTVTRVDVVIPPETTEVIHNTIIATATIVLNDPTLPIPLPRSNLTKNDLKLGGNQCPGTSAPPMARYSVHSMLVSLNIEDRPLRYSPAFGPAIDFTVTYNEKETQQPGTFPYSNLGPKWTFDWLSYVSDDPNSQLPQTGLYRSGGGAEVFAFDSTSQTFRPDAQSHATLVKTGAATYERRMPDGSKEVFAQSDGATSSPRRIFMSQIVDPAGNPVQIGYDASFRVITIADALGQVTNLSYDWPGDPLKISKITDPFGRFATFEYTSGQLTKITDEIGIQSRFTYTTGTDSIDTLATPYGTTTFSKGHSGTNRWIEMTDPLGGKERVEYRDQAPGISATDPVAPVATGIANAGLDVANTFYWDKKAMQVAPGDYTKAKITHWLYNADATVSGIASSEKQALENRVWFTYLGQPDYSHAGPTARPSQAARVLADNSTQLSAYEYNSLGNMTKFTDPTGRAMTYVYDSNQIDLLEVRQTTGTNNELLRKVTYNTLHEPLGDTDAAGQAMVYTYNPQGQVLTRMNPKYETTTYAYGGTVPTGCLASITSPPFNNVSAVTTFSYDSFKRVQTVTDSDYYAVNIDYDELDRKIKVTYPDTTFEQFQYTDNVTMAMTLDLTGTRDRRGLWTYRHYNANQQMDSITDPANRKTQYGWCTCGALTSITDPKLQTTIFNRDIQSRVYQKVFQGGTTIDYLYEGQTAPNAAGATSRLKSSADAKNQRTNYSYFADDTLKQINYTTTGGGALNPPTPTVNYTYDPNYNRLATMADGTGTTVYGYNPITIPPVLGAGQLATIDGPLTNDTVSYGYDQLGRSTSQAINGAANSMIVGFDSLGRLNSEVNNLGTFGYGYVGVTDRLQAVNYPNGQVTNYSYFSNSGDKQLQTLQNVRPNLSNLSKFDYVYDKEHIITQWTKQNDGVASQQLYLTYDLADQLVTWKNNTVPALHGGYIRTLTYDSAGNRQTDTYDEFPGGGWDPTETRKDETFSSVNQLTTVVGADPTPPPDPGPIHFGGEGEPPPPPPADTYGYDLNGNTTARVFWRGGGNTFEWDAANRLIAINYTGTTKRTEFTYDGLSQRKKIVEKTGPTVDSTKQFVWVGNRVAEERDASNVVTRRYYSQGEERIGGTTAGPYYYAKDHLGSIKELIDAAGSVRARYDYDPFGNTTKVSGDLTLDFGYTGHYRHTASNLYLAPYRAYDPAIGRWLSRDPIGERGGTNLYGYVLNNPTNWIDPLGLDVFVGEHPGVINNSHNPLNHAAIVLRPNNPADFADNPLFAATGGREATLGGQAFGGPWSAFIGSPYGNLRSAPNYPADAPANLNNITPVSCPSGKSDSQFINDIIRAANSYRNDQPYNPFGLNGTYNSNSYVSGVLTAAGAVPPVFGGVKPAYGTPLPIP